MRACVCVGGKHKHVGWLSISRAAAQDSTQTKALQDRKIKRCVCADLQPSRLKETEEAFPLQLARGSLQSPPAPPTSAWQRQAGNVANCLLIYCPEAAYTAAELPKRLGEEGAETAGLNIALGYYAREVYA